MEVALRIRERGAYGKLPSLENDLVVFDAVECGDIDKESSASFSMAPLIS